MKGSTGIAGEIFQRYAQALLSLAQEGNALDSVSQDVNSILTLLRESEELRTFLASPVYKADTKKAVLQQALGNSVHPFTKNFLMVLVDRRRIMLLEGICGEFQALLRKLNQIVLAEVISVQELSDEQKNALKEKVKTLTGARDVELDTKLDPELIGGVIIKIGSQVIDASLRGQLRRISLNLSNVS